MENLESSSLTNAPQDADVPVGLPPRPVNAGRDTVTTIPDQFDAVVNPAGSSTEAVIDEASADLPVTVLRARSGWQLFDVGEVYAYRDLLRFLVRREIKVRYAQSAIGVG